jgi:hypothetical protein
MTEYVRIDREVWEELRQDHESLRRLTLRSQRRRQPVIAGGGGGGGGPTLTGYFAQIDSHIGTTPPYTYTGRSVDPAGGGAFGTPAGADFELYNTAEIGISGSGVAPIPAGSIVLFYVDDTTGDRFFDRSFYRGTYA